ncbi:MAG: hypothetical protein FJY37_07590 [Betaproteobacteria bacterium]|nr:hypothetical protein [Betaproteobacteria bacterium]
MESLDYWRLCDELSIIQAALLLVESDPNGENGYAEDWAMHLRPHGYEAAKTAITNAFRRGAIKGRLIPNYEYDINGNQCGAIDDSINLVESRVEVESLRQWLETRGIRTGFFFPTATNAPDYLNPKNPRYAPKLAAAVRAWQSVIDAGGKHPKQALAKWLREHAAEFGMTDDEGKPNETGIEEAAKVANWQPGGGAPKTPGE